MAIKTIEITLTGNGHTQAGYPAPKSIDESIWFHIDMYIANG